MSGVQVAMLGGALIAWSAVFYRGWTLVRAPANPAGWAYWIGFLTLALNMTLLQPGVTRAVDGFAGVAGVTYLICDAAALLTCWSWLLCLYESNKPDPHAARQVRWLGVLILVALVYFTARFAVAPGQAQHRLAADPVAIYLAAYRLIFVGLIGLHMLCIGSALRRYAHAIDRPAIRLRLRLMIVATLLVIGFVLNEALRILGVPTPEIIGAICLIGAVLTMASTLVFGKRWAEWLVLWRWYRLYRRLYPLWRALYPVNPAMSFLPAPQARPGWPPRDDLAFILCRQVIEIRDWAFVLRPYQPSPTNDHRLRDRTLPETDHAAFTEAAQLASALLAWRTLPRGSELTANLLPPAAVQAHDRPPTVGTADWEREVAYLATVADYFAHSSQIRAMLGPSSTLRPAL